MFELSAVELQALVESELQQNPVLEEVEPLGGESGSRILPDLVLQKAGSEYVVTKNDGAIPHLRISETYDFLDGASGHIGGGERLHQSKVADGKRLIEDLEQRQKVLLAIGREIAKFQRDFLENRNLDIVPMGLPQALLAGLVGATASHTVIRFPINISRLVWVSLSWPGFSKRLDSIKNPAELRDYHSHKKGGLFPRIILRLRGASPHR